MTGPELATFAEEVNGGASIGDTLLFQLLNLSKAIVEQRRPWILLRSTDSSVTVGANNTWQTPIDLSGIARFSRFYGDTPIHLFDGRNGIQRFRQVPFNMRLAYKDAPGMFAYDESTKTLHLNGTIQFAGTLYIDHLKDSPELTNDDSSTWTFPMWAHPLLGFMAVGMHKGGIDYDDINARIAPDNRAQAEQIIRVLEQWDAEKQLSAQQGVDPYNDPGDGYREGAINIS
jgi:hypothetical protein